MQEMPIDHYENFPVASILCPPQLRTPIAAIYHFARTADDLADEGTDTAEVRLQKLQRYQSALHNLSAPCEWPEVFGPLARTMERFALPVALLNDLLLAFIQDVHKTRDAAGYRDEDELLAYCSRSANPVGRLLLHLYGIGTPAALKESDAICTALQLINFWQDLSVDIPRKRYYLPQSACEKYGLLPGDITELRQTSSATLLIAECVNSARARMLSGAPLVHRIPGRAGWELRFVVQGGLRILDKIESGGYRAFSSRPTLRWWDGAVIVWRCLCMRRSDVTIAP